MTTIENPPVTGLYPNLTLFQRLFMEAQGLSYRARVEQAARVTQLVEAATHLPPIEKHVIHMEVKKQTKIGLGVLRAQERECLKAQEGGAS